ncbi:hypothetical protein ACFJGV_06570 [Cnuibacter sp. UC19_7]|uniref:hypothetical protein n=1 Tax=Cnuibacter sp. UC19_7 TaxID=3350166 RepID=UPI003672957E
MTVIDTSSPDLDTRIAAQPLVSWRCAQAGLWVATGSDGRPLGIVSERWRDGFVTTSVTGANLGRFDTVEAARHALEQSVERTARR